MYRNPFLQRRALKSVNPTGSTSRCALKTYRTRTSVLPTRHCQSISTHLYWSSSLSMLKHTRWVNTFTFTHICISFVPNESLKLESSNFLYAKVVYSKQCVYSLWEVKWTTEPLPCLQCVFSASFSPAEEPDAALKPYSYEFRLERVSVRTHIQYTLAQWRSILEGVLVTFSGKTHLYHVHSYLLFSNAHRWRIMHNNCIQNIITFGCLFCV